MIKKSIIASPLFLALSFTVFLAAFQSYLSSYSLWRDPDYWFMATLAGASFYLGLWFYQRFYLFWRARESRLPLYYGVAIILAYPTFIWGFYAKYPYLGLLSFAGLYPWALLLAAVFAAIMVSPTILILNQLLNQWPLLRRSLGLLLVILFLYPYFVRDEQGLAKPNILIKASSFPSDFELQDSAFHVSREPDLSACPGEKMRLWREAPFFAPFVWFMTAPFTGRRICVPVTDRELAAIEQFNWDQNVTLVWSSENWKALESLWPHFNKVSLKVNSDSQSLWQIEKREIR